MTSPSAGPTGPAGAAVIDGLQRVLGAQHAAVFGYPALGVHLDDQAEQNQAAGAEANHRATRDTLAAQLVALGASPVASQPQYSPPTELTSVAAARRWAVALEEESAAAYRYLLVCAAPAGSAELAIRKQAVTGLTAAASAALYWRRLVSPDRPTVPFPGT